MNVVYYYKQLKKKLKAKAKAEYYTTTVLHCNSFSILLKSYY